MSFLRTSLTTSLRRSVYSSSSPALRAVLPFAQFHSTPIFQLADTQLSEGEQALKTKLAGKLEGANIDVQDVSGQSRLKKFEGLQQIILTSIAFGWF